MNLYSLGDFVLIGSEASVVTNTPRVSQLKTSQSNSASNNPKQKRIKSDADLSNRVIKGFKALEFLRIQEKTGARIWLWECLACGNKIERSIGWGNTQDRKENCGCLGRKIKKPYDFKGKIFNNALKACEFVKYINNGKKNSSVWRFNCLLCGGNIDLTSSQAKKRKSCGCLNRPNKIKNILSTKPKKILHQKDEPELITAPKVAPKVAPKTAFKDIKGQVFGKLKAIEFIRSECLNNNAQGPKSTAIWLFECLACGNRIEINTQQRNSCKKHCGCLSRPKKAREEPKVVNVGDRIGSLRVERFVDEKRLLANCTCGEQRIISIKSWGHLKSCGSNCEANSIDYSYLDKHLIKVFDFDLGELYDDIFRKDFPAVAKPIKEDWIQSMRL